MKRRALLAALAAAPALCRTARAADGAAAPGPLSVGIQAAGLRAAVQLAFEAGLSQAAGGPVRFADWDGSAAGLAGFDLGLADGLEVAALVAANALAAIDWKTLGRDRVLGPGYDEHGVGLCVRSTVLAWDQEKVAEAPELALFFDVARRPGRRGLRKRARGTLELALLADGVRGDAVAGALRSGDGADRAFRKLDQLRPYVAWWDDTTDPVQLLASAAVLLTAAPVAPVTLAAAASHRNFGVGFGGSVYEVTRWVIPRGAARQALATRAIAATLEPGRQAQFAAVSGEGALGVGAVALLSQDQQNRSASLPRNLALGVAIDDGFWVTEGAALEKRFAAWVKG
jgi:putative spermidine/putrescine transport system substrate-binding protein